MLDTIEQLLGSMAGWVWGPPLLVLLFGTHLFLTVRLGFIQRYVWRGIKLSLARDTEGAGDVSHFGALATALAATIGTGNIVGVATALGLGGPGALLWMWLTGVFGISTKYAEALLSVKYRVTTASGAMAGGPMYVLERGMNARWLGLVFAAFTALAGFGIGNMVQANSIADLAEQTVSLPRWMTGVGLAGLTALVVLRGIRSIARVCMILVPFMAAAYVLGCLVLLAMHVERIPDTLAVIVQSAFGVKAAAGGLVGVGVREAMRYGIARGLFSNESGLGSAPIVAAAAQTRDPVRQALVSATGTFWDTVVVCALTGLVLVNSGAWTVVDSTGEPLVGAALTRAAFADLSFVGPLILNLGLLTFVFSTILGWCYYGEKAAEYLFGPGALRPYRVLWVIAVVLGATLSLPIVWNFSDVMNGLMAVPNLISLLWLNKVLVSETKRHMTS